MADLSDDATAVLAAGLNAQARDAGASPGARAVRRRVWSVALVVPLAVVLPPLLRWLVFGTAIVRVDASPGLLAQLVALTALAMVATRTAVRTSAQGSSGSRLTLVAWLAAPLYAVMIVARPLSAEQATHLDRLGRPCASLATITAALVLATATFALRGAVPAATRRRGAALGAAAGCWAGVALFMHCPAQQLVHLLVGHTLPIAAFAVLGALACARVLRP